MFFQVFSTFPLVLRDLYGMPTDHIGFAIAVNALIIVLFEMVTMHAMRGRAPLRVIRLGTLFACAAFVLLPWGVGIGVPWVLLVVVLITLGEMFYMPIAEGFAANSADPRSRGRYIGMYALAYSLGFAVAPAIGTWVYDRHGAGALGGGCGVAGIVLWLGFTRLRRASSSLEVRNSQAASPPRRLP